MQTIKLPEPTFKKLFSLELASAEAVELGGGNSIAPAADGSFTGETLSGIVQHGGSVRLFDHKGDKRRLTAEYVLMARDGAFLTLRLEGFMGQDGCLARALLVSGAKKYAMLNSTVAFALSEWADGRERLGVYALSTEESVRASAIRLPAEKLFDMELDMETAMPAGRLSEGRLLIRAVAGGQCMGSALCGDVLPLGADWNVLRQGEPARGGSETRCAIRTDDGAAIALSCISRMQMSSGAMKKLMQKKQKQEPPYCYGQHIVFNTGDSRYAYLGDAVAFAVTAMRAGGKLCSAVYRLV